MRLIIWLIALIALGLALAVLISGPGTRFGLWDYETGLKIIRKVAEPIAIAGPVKLSPIFTAVGLALAGAITALFLRARALAVLALVATIAAGAAGYAPLKMKQMATANPFIHDITTDFENPPAIVAAAGMDRKNPPDYAGDAPAPGLVDGEYIPDSGKTVAEAQREAFPDIQPLALAVPLEEAVKAARAVLDDMRLETLAEGPAGDEAGSGWRIEAVATSLWYGFKDDFVVRLTPLAEGGVRVDVRSESRVGGSDLGANAARVRTFLKKLDAAA